MSSQDPTSCRAFLQWLDDGMQDAASPAAIAHARRCAACAAELAVARAIDASFARSAAYAPPAPARITDAVMARVAAIERMRRPLDVELMFGSTSPLPWWVRAAAQPSAALALVLAAIVLWRPLELLSAAMAWFASMSAWVRQLPAARVPTAAMGIDLARPEVAIGLALAAAPALAWAAWALWRWGERRA